MPRFLMLLPALILGGCAYHTSRSSVVVITDSQQVVEGCTSLGKIDGQSSLRAIMPLDKNRDSVITRLKIDAAEMGGTHVVAAVADVKWTGGDSSGTVYKCGSR